MSTTTEKHPGREQRSAAKAAALREALLSFDQLPDSAHVRLPTVAAWRGTSTSAVWRHVQAGLLPKPVKLGPRTTAWKVGDLRGHVSRQDLQAA